jgi:uncharacterized protein (DUF1697 family)
MMTFIALLRAINLGNHRSLAMSALRDFIADLSFTDARTLLQQVQATDSQAGE